MKSLGNKLFKNAAIGGGAGAVGGGIFGAIKAQKKIDALPTQEVNVDSYQRPVFEEQQIGENTMFDQFDEKYKEPIIARVPVRNEDGSLKMETAPERTVTGKGEAIRGSRTHDIETPDYLATRPKEDSHEYKVVRYRKIGEWEEPMIRFDTGVSRIAHVFGYAAAGMAIGATGGALVTLALDKLTGEEQKPAQSS